MDPAQEAFTLGDWLVDAPGNRLLRGGEVRPLRHKAMALLVLLARHPGETVTREHIVQAVWDGNRFVAPKAINTAVWTIRQALGDDPEQPRYLQTIAKKGYRLIAPVQPVAVAGAAVPPPAPAPVAVQQPARPARPRRVVATAAVAAALAAAAAGWAWWNGQGAPPAPSVPPARVVSPLTHNPGHEYLGRLSPDGRWLALGWWQGQGTGALFLRPAADLAAPPQPVSGDAGEVNALAWSPDGRALAFTATAADGRCTLWLQPVAGGARDGPARALAACAPMFTPSLDWSPDGRWLAFSAEADGAGGLFLVAPDGSGLRRLTTAPPAALADHQPAWSPDSQRLAFVRQDPADGSRDLHETGLDGDVRRLSTLRLQWLHGLSFLPDGQDLVLSTTQQDTRVLLRWQRSSGQLQPLGLEGSAPAVGADGRIVYALLRTHVSVARLAAPGAAPQRLIQSVASDRMPDHHASSGTVFVSRRSGHPELWLAPADGAAPRALTQLQGTLAAPAWSPRGDAVAFLGSCGPGRRIGLCLLPHPGGAPRPLAADAARYGRPTWHPSGDAVWVPSDRGGRWQLWRFAVDGSGAASALDTASPPGRALQWAPDGSGFVYQPRLHDGLRWRAAASGAERPLASLPAGERLLDWRWGTDGLLLLSRGDAERFHRLDPATGRLQLLGAHALGTFPEQASFALGDGGSLLVEQADVAVADLMQAR